MNVGFALAGQQVVAVDVQAAFKRANAPLRAPPNPRFYQYVKRAV